MATIETLNKRIEGREKALAKLEKKLERIEKAQASNWENNPYWYNENDLKWTLRDIEEVKANLEKYRKELEVALEKEASRDVEVILTFLEMWKERCKSFYADSLPKYVDTLLEYYKADNEYCQYHNYHKRDENFKSELMALAKVREDAKFKLRAWNFMSSYVDYQYDSNGNREYFLDMEKIQKDLDNDAKAKYDFIIERTNEITGKIVDASGLSIGAKGDLNGDIIGERGVANVHTIGAGGYNIQCFHFRTLIHKVA